MQYDIRQIRDLYTVADCLRDFSIELRGGRGPCPFCHTSEHSDAFSTKGQADRWRCFACNEWGDSVDLYAHLAGTTKGTAVREIAQSLGLAEVDEAVMRQRLEARRIAAAIVESRHRAECERLNQLASKGRKAVHRARLLRLLAARASRAVAPGLIWKALAAEEIMAACDRQLDYRQLDP